MNLQSHELRKSVKFENLLKVKFGSRGTWRFPERGDSRTSKKQSQRRHLKKSGFSVWTSGKIVNVWNEKDIHVCVHIRNILRARGCFRNVKVSSSHYKRGREGPCKDRHNFWGFCSLCEILSLLLRRCITWTCSLYFHSCLGISSGFSDPPTALRALSVLFDAKALLNANSTVVPLFNRYWWLAQTKQCSSLIHKKKDQWMLSLYQLWTYDYDFMIYWWHMWYDYQSDRGNKDKDTYFLCFLVPKR
jgi:hypothetical protein